MQCRGSREGRRRGGEKEVLRELGSGKVGYNKHELVNVMMVRKMDGAYFARQISKAKNIRIW